MIRKNKFGSLTVYCDGCTDFVDTIEDSFSEAWLDAKREGWSQLSEDGRFVHYCPDCWRKMNE